MDRKIYKLPFKKEGYLQWVCPGCEKGMLTFIKDTFNTKETEVSRKIHKEFWWDPSHSRDVYSCLLECSNSFCKEVVSSSGIGFVEQDGWLEHEDEDGRSWGHSENYVQLFRPAHFSPNLKIFSISDKVPKDIIEEINKSFSVFFCDYAAAANHIRVAVEKLLTILKVNRFMINPKSKQKNRISLHGRIQLLPPKYNGCRDLLLALKWVGNTGSHEGELTIDDILDMYEIMEEVLKKLYSKNAGVEAMVKKINKSKGIPKGKKV